MIVICVVVREVEMSIEEYVCCLWLVLEYEVIKVFNGVKVVFLLIIEYEVFEFFNCMLDVMSNVCVDEEEVVLYCIKFGFGSMGE